VVAFETTVRPPAPALRRRPDDGRTKGTIGLGESANKTARTNIGTLEGAMLLARLLGDVAGFRSATAPLDGTARRTIERRYAEATGVSAPIERFVMLDKIRITSD
jgi:hypothetical protein